jgi:hypothetical protein
MAGAFRRSAAQQAMAAISVLALVVPDYPLNAVFHHMS